jgi:hypothetical protein
MSSDDITVDSIVGNVRHVLESLAEGKRKVESLTEHFKRLRNDEVAIRSFVKRLGQRPGATFYATVGGSRKEKMVIDVRIDGESCGSVDISDAVKRYFKPKNHTDEWHANEAKLEWSDSRVREYLDRAAPRVRRRTREATSESAFLTQVGQTRGREAKGVLAGYRPVTLAGLPFQFPLPTSAREVTARLSAGVGSAGHADILLRGPGGRLKVVEVKKKGASDVGHALDQAIGYCASLQFLIEYDDVYYHALGYPRRRTPPRIDAGVLVHDDPAAVNSVKKAAERLGGRNRHFDLFAFFYRWEETAGSKKFVVDRLEVLNRCQP